jgi:hypothetical protein
METERFDAVVVGTGKDLLHRANLGSALTVNAGWNGLIAAKTYLDFKPGANLILVDEQASIGGVWSAERVYPSLFAQIKYGLFEYSFYPMRRGMSHPSCLFRFWSIFQSVSRELSTPEISHLLPKSHQAEDN